MKSNITPLDCGQHGNSSTSASSVHTASHQWQCLPGLRCCLLAYLPAQQAPLHSLNALFPPQWWPWLQSLAPVALTGTQNYYFLKPCSSPLGAALLLAWLNVPSSFKFLSISFFKFLSLLESFNIFVNNFQNTKFLFLSFTRALWINSIDRSDLWNPNACLK